MRTFETQIRGRSFWMAVVVPPLIYFALLVAFAANTGGQPMSSRALLALTALAYVFPLIALAWLLCSTSAYSLQPGKLIAHSVLRDRVEELPHEVAPAWTGACTVEFRLRRKRCRVHVREPLAFLLALRTASVAGR
ncbi:MAG: hypothetical protein NVV63_09015 [Opitutus sp.]|nr:hypothetical protein [Opitutus sp.]